MVEDALEISHGVPGVAGREHHELGVVGLAVFELHNDGGGDALGVFLVVGFPAVLEGALLHEFAGVGVVDGLVAVVLGFEHQKLPHFIEVLEGVELISDILSLKCLPQNGTDDIHHRMISRLSSLWTLLSRITNNPKGRLIRHNLDILNIINPILRDKLTLVDDLLQPLQGPRRLMLIQSQFEVHTHNRKVITLSRQGNIERRIAVSLFVESEDGLRVSEDVLRTDEASHGSLDAHDGRLGGQGGGGALGVAELLPGADGSEGDVVGAEHADARFDLLWGGAEKGAVGTH